MMIRDIICLQEIDLKLSYHRSSKIYWKATPGREGMMLKWPQDTFCVSSLDFSLLVNLSAGWFSPCNNTCGCQWLFNFITYKSCGKRDWCYFFSCISRKSQVPTFDLSAVDKAGDDIVWLALIGPVPGWSTVLSHRSFQNHMVRRGYSYKEGVSGQTNTKHIHHPTLYFEE